MFICISDQRAQVVQFAPQIGSTPTSISTGRSMAIPVAIEFFRH